MTKRRRKLESSQQHGRRLGLASQGQHWLACARRLLDEFGLHNVSLGIVAAHRSATNALMLVDGTSYLDPDMTAGAELAGAIDDIRDKTRRMTDLRNKILHLSDPYDDGLGIKVDYVPGGWTYSARVIRNGSEQTLYMTNAEIGSVLDRLEPWFRSQLERLT